MVDYYLFCYLYNIYIINNHYPGIFISNVKPINTRVNPFNTIYSKNPTIVMWYLEINFALAHNSQDKNENWDRGSKPIFLQSCGSETVFQ